MAMVHTDDFGEVIQYTLIANKAYGSFSGALFNLSWNFKVSSGGSR